MQTENVFFLVAVEWNEFSVSRERGRERERERKREKLLALMSIGIN